MKKIKLSKNIKKVLAFYGGVILAIMIIVISSMIFYSENKVGDEKIDKIDGFTISDSSVSNSLIHVDKIKVYRKATGAIQVMDIEDYVKGVVSAEMPANFDEEALKAQAVAARTFAVNKIVEHCSISHGADICDSTHCQVYMDKDKRMKSWGKDAQRLYKKVSDAVESTKGQVITYDGKIISYPQYFAISPGKTEDSVDVFNKNIPYLKSVSSEGENIAPKYKSYKIMTVYEFVKVINGYSKKSGLTSYNLGNNIKILSSTESGAVKEIKLGNITVSGIKFRSLFGLNSSSFKIDISGNKVTISCTGYGHNTGMSQWGANVMAKNGSDYKQILYHYYVGTKIQKIE